MIPADLAARLRMLGEASFFDSQPPIQGPAKVREIQARLPQLLPGQTFTANIQRALPDGTYQAAVAGRSYTLALNHAAKAGDTLELVVSRNTPQAVFAQVLDSGGSAAASASRPQLSPTGQLISFMLSGQPAPKPAQLAEGKPLVPSPPTAGVPALPLANALRQAVGQSGLFYESHQHQWLAGKRDQAALGKEPQGQAHGAAQRATSSPGQMTASAPAATSGQATEAKSASGQLIAKADEAITAAREASSPRPLSIPERILPVVHQQLEGLATQQYPLLGQAWPGQPFELVMHERDGNGSQDGDSDDSNDWQTTLRLSMPMLGEVQAHLSLAPGGITLRLVATDEMTRERLEAGQTRLSDSLEAAGLHLAGFVVEQVQPDISDNQDTDQVQSDSMSDPDAP